MDQLWEVIGGAESGGIIVRAGADLESEKQDRRLSVGAVVEETEIRGDRLKYRLRDGSGPAIGWVSVNIKSKPLLKRIASRSVGTESVGQGGQILKSRWPCDSSSMPDGAPEAVCCLGGPILLSAPHSVALVRNGKWKARERGTAELAVLLARELHGLGLPASFIVWDPTRMNPERLDPNVSVAETFKKCPFHMSLQRWVLNHGGLDGKTPLFHIDLHGKVSELHNLDVGTMALQCVWNRAEFGFVNSLSKHLGGLFQANLAESDICHLDGQRFGVDVAPRLHGFWGDERNTMVTQSARLGVPSVQLEMPPAVRILFFKRAARDQIRMQQLVRDLALSIKLVYDDLITPAWTARSPNGGFHVEDEFKIPVDEQLGNLVMEQHPELTSNFQAWSAQLVEDLLNADADLICDTSRFHRGDFQMA